MTRRNLPSIILLLLDAAGARHFSLYGYHRPTTPFLERLAPEAAVYRHCFSPAPWTVPSHVSLFTGLYPQEHLCNSRFTGLPKDILSLPEILTELGYRTLAISSNLLVSRALGFHRGFAEFYEMDTLFHESMYLEGREHYLKAKKDLKNDWEKILFVLKYIFNSRDITYPLKKGMDRLYKKYLADVTKSTAFMSRRSMRLAKKLIQKHRDAPFFLFMNLMETHARFKAPRPFNKKFQSMDPELEKKFTDPHQEHWYFLEDEGLREQLSRFRTLGYDQEISYTDHLLGDFLHFLKEQGLLEQAVVIITSDHGEALGEHGLFGHAFSVYNELLHIPLMVRFPRAFGVQGEFNRVVQLHDLFATICQLADSPWPLPFSSHSLLDGSREFALAGLLDNSRGLDSMRRRHPAFQLRTSMLPGEALIGADLWKLIRWQDGARELYDLNRDLYEGSNLINDPQHADKAAFLGRQLKEVSYLQGLDPGAF